LLHNLDKIQITKARGKTTQNKQKNK